MLLYVDLYGLRTPLINLCTTFQSRGLCNIVVHGYWAFFTLCY